MTTTRTFTCPTCGATLATTAPPGTTITCEYCKSPFVVPGSPLDQPGDAQATVIANFQRRGNPSPMPPTGPDGTPPSTPEQPPHPDSPAGVGNTVDSDAAQPLVERGPVQGTPAAAAPPEPVPEASLPDPSPEPSPEPELRTPEIMEELDSPAVVDSPEPEPPIPPTADPRASEMTMIAPSRVRAALDAQAAAAPQADSPPPAEPEPAPEPDSVPVGPEFSVADLIAEPTKYGAAIPSEQGEPVVTGPGEVKVMPPQTPAVGGPPGAAMRSGSNRTPMLIGGVLLVLCCLLGTCAVLAAVVPALLRGG